ncbi:MAG: hypothetical protein A2428_12190 [Bdellovibrionales bacterium RIFOXYC1_FULL_54_43]|nr:MAG: hypothetical protein A2428_12190 [Bdellovibrionales bacterium RIFOXYC1_FULL_54_43]
MEQKGAPPGLAPGYRAAERVIQLKKLLSAVSWAGIEQSMRSAISSEWTFSDHWGQLRSRVSGFRMRYTVEPGIYALNSPGEDSPVIATANYKLSFDKVRRALTGKSAWILVLNTHGINVWCAAGKGRFGTFELMKRIREAELEKLVRHRKVIVPQLGAPGVVAHRVQKETGFRVFYGPVRAADLPLYIDNGMTASREMRLIQFPMFERLVLIPMEWVPGFRKTILPATALSALSGLLFGWSVARDVFFLFQLMLIAGAVGVPALLPWIPGRAFAFKGWILGMFACLVYPGLVPPGLFENTWIAAAAFVFFPLLSSFVALEFTGATPITGMSAVKREMRFAVPIYRAALYISVTLFMIAAAAELPARMVAKAGAAVHGGEARQVTR